MTKLGEADKIRENCLSCTLRITLKGNILQMQVYNTMDSFFESQSFGFQNWVGTEIPSSLGIDEIPQMISNTPSPVCSTPTNVKTHIYIAFQSTFHRRAPIQKRLVHFLTISTFLSQK